MQVALGLHDVVVVGPESTGPPGVGVAAECDELADAEQTDLGPVGKLRWLTTLDIVGNQIESLEPLTTLRELDMLLMSRNKVADLGPLVEMCRKDAEGDRRFAPYMEVYLGENPIDEKKKSEQTKTLESFGVDIYDK